MSTTNVADDSVPGEVAARDDFGSRPTLVVSRVAESGPIVATLNARFSATIDYGRLRIGMSLPFPHWTPAVVPLLEYMMNHVPFDGRKTAMSVLPSPS
jgi:hypothetical protein